MSVGAILGEWGSLAIQGGAVGMLGAVVFAIFRGLLVPRGTLDVLRADLEKRVATAERTAEQWRQAYFAASAQADALMVVARVTEQTMRALPTVIVDSEPAP